MMEKKKKIKWMKPELESLNAIETSVGICSTTGSGDADGCANGPSATGLCGSGTGRGPAPPG